MGNKLRETDENTGTMEVLERHQFDVSKLQDFMYENIEGFEGNIQLEDDLEMLSLNVGQVGLGNQGIFNNTIDRIAQYEDRIGLVAVA